MPSFSANMLVPKMTVRRYSRRDDLARKLMRLVSASGDDLAAAVSVVGPLHPFAERREVVPAEPPLLLLPLWRLDTR